MLSKTIDFKKWVITDEERGRVVADVGFEVSLKHYKMNIYCEVFSKIRNSCIDKQINVTIDADVYNTIKINLSCLINDRDFMYYDYEVLIKKSIFLKYLEKLVFKLETADDTFNDDIKNETINFINIIIKKSKLINF